MAISKLDTNQKALQINLDASKYGSVTSRLMKIDEEDTTASLHLCKSGRYVDGYRGRPHAALSPDKSKNLSVLGRRPVACHALHYLIELRL